MLNDNGIIDAIAIRPAHPTPFIYGRQIFAFSGNRRQQQTELRVQAPRTAGNGSVGISKSPEELTRELEQLAREQSALAPERAYQQAGRRLAMLQGSPSFFAAFPGTAQVVPAQLGARQGNELVRHTTAQAGEAVETEQNALDPLASPPKSVQQTEANTGGEEARSADRTFLGGTAGATGRSGPGKDSSGQKENAEGDEAENSLGAPLSEEEQREVQKLKSRDKEVRAHEQAHISAGGGLTSGGANFQKTRGPDGNMYAVGGEVQIDTSEAGSPEETIAKAQRVKAAALAPAQPSPQDRQVAVQAAQMEATARQEKIAAPEKNSGKSSASPERTVAADPANQDNTKASGLETLKPDRAYDRTYRADRAYRKAASLNLPFFTNPSIGISLTV